MTDADAEQDETASRRRAAKWVLALVVVAALMAGVIYPQNIGRSILVTAETATLTLEFRETAAPKYLGPISVCRPDPFADGAAGAVEQGCWLEMNARYDLAGREIAFPRGSRVEIRLSGDRLNFEILALPEDWENADAPDGYAVGDILSVPAARMPEFGQMAARAAIWIGTLPGTSDHGTLDSGHYEIRGHTLYGVLFGRRELNILRAGDLKSGGQVRLVSARSGRDVSSYVHLSPATNPTRHLRVVAVSEYGPIDLSVQHFLSRRTLVRSSFADMILGDALLQVIALLAAVLGIYRAGWKYVVVPMRKQRGAGK